MRASGVICFAVAFLLAAAASAEEPGRPAPLPDVLLITIDTLRPDALGWIGGGNDTPAVDQLAARGFRFPTAVTPVPLTLPAHASIMTGLIPRRHGVRDNGQSFGTDVTTLGEILGSRGYSTAAFVSGYPLDRIFGLDRGFDHYDDTMPEGTEGWLERVATDTTEAVLEWLPTATSPWFVWVHYYDPHDPYEPPRSFWGPGLRGAYLGEVRFTDYAIEKLVDGVGRREGGGLLTVLTADHGEALGEHDEKRHGYFVYDSTMTVPLVFHWPGRIPATESRAAARLVDVAPTILALVGAPALKDVDGLSLVPLFDGEDLELPPAYLETRLPWIFYGWSPLAAIRTADWKLIDAPRPELYYLAEDPGEKHDMLASRPQRAAELRAHLEEIEAVPGRASRSVVDDEALARLRALGYVGAGESPDAVPEGLADPKDRIDLRNRLQEAEQAAGAGRYSEAVRRFDEVLEIEQDNRCAVLRSGVALLKAGRPEAAVPRLQRATELDPDRAEAQYALADALMRIDAPARAVAHWQELTRLQPRRAEAWFNLGAASAAAGELDRAVAAHRKAGDLDPGNPAFLRGLALAEAAAGESSAAAAHFETLVEMVGLDGFADAASYGLVLAELERTPEAVEWLGRSRPEEPDHAEARIRLARIELEAGNVEAARSALAEALAADPGSIRLIDGDAELSSLLD